MHSHLIVCGTAGAGGESLAASCRVRLSPRKGARHARSMLLASKSARMWQNRVKHLLLPRRGR